jgi:hypothetical protein
MAGNEVHRLPLVALGPLAIAIVGWLGARWGRPGLTLCSAVLLAGYVGCLMLTVYGVLPFLYVPGAVAMLMAVSLGRRRPVGGRVEGPA